jgi:hypothetical protein
MKITWKKLADQSYHGFDEAENQYRQPANGETTTVYLKDGRKAQAWTPEKALERAMEQSLIIRVWSGVDAFVINTPAGKVYVPSFDVIAKTHEEARQKVAQILGQKLEDQESNSEYDNYVSDHTEIVGYF